MSSTSADTSDPLKKESLELCAWLNTMDLCRPKKRIHRDFSDGYLLAMIVKKSYPHLIEVHNYIPTSKFAMKINNWKLLKSKVLKKLHIRLSEKMMEDIANCVPGVIENVLLDLKNKIHGDFHKKVEKEDTLSSDGSWYDVEVIDENCDIMIVPIRKKICDDQYEVIRKKVISYETYDSVLNELTEKHEAIDVLKKKVEHLEELLKNKDNHIEELQKNMARKALRTKKNELSLMKTDPEKTDSELIYISNETGTPRTPNNFKDVDGFDLNNVI